MIDKTILAIETSCDETAAAVVKNGVGLISEALASSAEIHEKTGGVVPEIAARKQVECIVPVIAKALEKYYLAERGNSKDSLEQDDVLFQKTIIGFAQKNIDAIAVTVGPGLIGSLLVGVEAAKALGVAWEKPVIPVNHLVGHIYGNFINITLSDGTVNEPAKRITFPALVLIVSGGHTDLVLMKNHGDFEFLGSTLDDAAGEAFDKTARLLGLTNYLMGGPLISKAAQEDTKNLFKHTLPRPMLHTPDFNFSFSGLKTAVKKLYEDNIGVIDKEDLVTSISKDFEEAVVEVLVTKVVRAAKVYSVKSILVAGGVAANTLLRKKLEEQATYLGTPLFIPPVKLCTDNAVYIASAAYFACFSKQMPGEAGLFNPAAVSLENLDKILADPSLSIMDNVYGFSMS